MEAETRSASAPPEAEPERDPAPLPRPPDDDEPDEPDEPGESDEPTAGDAAGGLSDRDLAVLAMARRGWHTAGAKERAIREQLDISPTRYYQLLDALLEHPEALAHDPVTVNRLRRVREARRRRR